MRARSVRPQGGLRLAADPRISGLGVWLLLAAGGCGFKSNQRPGNTPDPDASVDAVDAPPDVAIDACTSFAGQLDTCAMALAGDLTLPMNAVFDTDAQKLFVNGVEVPVAHAMINTAADVDSVAILVHDFRLPENVALRATGSLPLAIVASGSIILSKGASIDVSNGGAGALARCSTPASPGQNDDGGAGGGGGGGYSGAGGRGGNGDLDTVSSAGGAGAASISMPGGPQGGCAGAAGGVGDNATPGGPAGLGGGAVYLAAADRIELGEGAVIAAGGGGGKGGNSIGGKGDSGGGGGGSGGMILLEAPHVIGPMSTIVANGGGGGEGSSTTQAGNNGQDGQRSEAQAAGGSQGPPSGGDGGKGGSVFDAPGESVSGVSPGGAGGGGGGVGYVRVISADFQPGVVSPRARD